MPYEAKAIANCFLDLAKRDGIADVSPMKLQKLVYFAHAWYLALTEEPLLMEPVEAWDYGPVIESLYHEFKHFGSRPITCPATDDVTGCPVPPPNEPGVLEFLKEVWAGYRDVPALRLSDMTHQAGSPWEVTRRDNPGRRAAIPDDLIGSHYRKALESARDERAN